MDQAPAAPLATALRTAAPLAADPLAADLEAIEAAARNIGVQPGDPVFPFLRALTRLLAAFAGRLDSFARHLDESGRQPTAAMSPENQERLLVAIPYEVRTAARDGVRAALTSVRPAVYAGAVGFNVALVAIAAAAGYDAGLDAGRAEVAASVADMRAAMSDGGAAALVWRKLIAANGAAIADEVAACEAMPAQKSGKACEVALWTVAPAP